MRFGSIFLLAALALPAPALAGGTKGDYTARRGAIVTPETGGQTDLAEFGLPRFVASNIRETIYHELAHLLIDQLDLPVFGPQEFAADLFATVMINRLFDEDAAIAMTYDVAAAYDAGALKENDYGAGPAMWGVHGTDRQRYYNFVCMMYGANPEAREDVADELGLPDERKETCEEEYALTARAWGEVLDRVAENAPGTSLQMDWMLDAESPLARFVRAEVDRLNSLMALPKETAVSVIPCEEINAYYDPNLPEMLICTELGDHLAELAE